jgi:hypothetical protein
MPVILATREAEIRMIIVPGQPGQKNVCESVSQLRKKLGMMMLSSQLQWDHSPGCPEQKARPYLQNNQNKKGWRYGSSVEHLPT